MKTIYEVRLTNQEGNESKCITAYGSRGPAINKVKELNAKNYLYGELYYMNKKIIEEKHGSVLQKNKNI